ncbi:hypothetical protein [Mucilaginibacter sp. BT774]|uniref:hypothetical protein n=1 Tax=Mucilaginibacter sp. BT774 TaxID=3062276 RepID=UPI00267644D9|nr:hypothetical protein [Mucilaginibacter sp. BT774]MDO3626226.1 hypothetical protein [Mucilaginibacter sp. BT774]
MKKSIKICVGAIALFTFFSLHSSAQTSVAKTESYGSGIRLSLGADGGIPVGSLNTGYNWNAGGSVQADFPILKDQLYATLNSGYNAIFASSQYNIPDIHLIPVKAGLKYFIIKQVYIQGEAGVSFLTNKNDMGADKSAVFVYAPQAGVLLNIGGKNYIDAGFRFESNQKFFNGGNTANFLAIRIAYAFNL